MILRHSAKHTDRHRSPRIRHDAGVERPVLPRTQGKHDWIRTIYTFYRAPYQDVHTHTVRVSSLLVFIRLATIRTLIQVRQLVSRNVDKSGFSRHTKCCLLHFLSEYAHKPTPQATRQSARRTTFEGVGVEVLPLPASRAVASRFCLETGDRKRFIGRRRTAIKTPLRSQDW
jgi:hypothetical protein